MSDDRNARMQPATSPASTEGTAFGVLSILVGAGGTVPVVGVILAILGIVLGNIAKNRGKRTGNSVGATLGIIGMVISSITLVIAVIVLFLAGDVIGSLFSLGGPGFR